MTEKRSSTIKSFDKGIDILSKFAFVKSTWGIRELADELNLTKSTVHRLIKTLERRGLLEQDEINGKYKMGIELFSLSTSITLKFSLIDICSTAMRSISDSLNETIYLYLFRDDHIVFVHKEDTNNMLKYVVKLGVYHEIFLAAAGKSVLAFLPEEKINIILSKDLKKYTPNTITDVDTIKQQLETIRKNKYAFSKGERYEGTVGYAAPIFNSKGRVLGGITITFPETRYHEEKHQFYCELIKNGGEKISHDLGYRSPSQHLVNKTNY
jgi:IclR family transcriptional regulator, KDG regulon repressor